MILYKISVDISSKNAKGTQLGICLKFMIKNSFLTCLVNVKLVSAQEVLLNEMTA